jgi:hypothetical protein
MAWSAAISWIVLRSLIASMATLALNSRLWVRRLLNSFREGYAYGGSPFQGWCPASEANDGGCPGKPDHRSPGVGCPSGPTLGWLLCRPAWSKGGGSTDTEQAR